MKKTLMAMGVAVVMLCGTAMADGQVPFVFKPISVEDQWYGDKGVKIDVSSVKKGIFISANGAFKTTYPKTTQLVKEIFKAKGLPVVEKVEDADVGIMLIGGAKFGSLEAVEVDVDSVSDTARIGTSLLIQIGFNLATGKFLPPTPAGFSPDRDGQGDIAFTIVKNPKLNWQNKIGGDDSKLVASQLTYRLNRKPVKEDHFGSLQLTEITDKFVDQHFVGISGKVPVVAPASAVPVATN